ncbi:MAG: aminoacetone oxidase family FAD-binding enzyme [Lachnospiraceae bacterium]|nr:aminoacetone oxidase family FAD-binding enzyme [Lachnospiraceae bacterium]
MRIAVIGGGAAGLSASIAAADNGAEVTLFERNDRVGKKLLLTGNGRCNLTNLSMDTTCYYPFESRDFVREELKSFSSVECISFFENLGLITKDKNGYVYPHNEQASSVLDILRNAVSNRGIELKTQHEIIDIKPDCGNKRLFGISAKTGNENGEEEKRYYFDRVILATGGMSYKKTGSDGNGYQLLKGLGHSIVKPMPALCALKGEGGFYKAVSGVRCEAELSLFVNDQNVCRESGELQITDYGISGIPVFQFSRLAGEALKDKSTVKVTADFLPGLPAEDMEAFADSRIKALRVKSFGEFFEGLINKKLMLLILKKSGLKPEMAFEGARDRERVLKVFRLIKGFDFVINSTNSFDNAQTTAGGVPVAEINADYSSKIISWLYIIGELVDIDGKCGGYNLHHAWMSGIRAGKSAAV